MLRQRRRAGPSSGLRIEPRSPPVQVTTSTSTPSATYWAVRRRALARLVVGVGVHVHEPEAVARARVTMGCWDMSRQPRIGSVRLAVEHDPDRAVRRALGVAAVGRRSRPSSCSPWSRLAWLAWAASTSPRPKVESQLVALRRRSTQHAVAARIDVRLASRHDRRDLHGRGPRQRPLDRRRAALHGPTVGHQPGDGPHRARSPPRWTLPGCTADGPGPARADLAGVCGFATGVLVDCSLLAAPRRRNQHDRVPPGGAPTPTRHSRAPTRLWRSIRMIWLTQETFDRLKAELEELRGPVRAEIVRTDQRRPRRGRPQGERRLPRRQGGAGQERGPHPPARGACCDGAQVGETPAGRRQSSSPAWSSPTASPATTTRRRSCSAPARWRTTATDIEVYSPQSPARRRHHRRPRSATTVDFERPTASSVEGRDRQRGALHRLTPSRRR